MPRASQNSTTKAKDVALRTRDPHAVIVGSSTYSCIRPGAHGEDGEQEASEMMACDHRAGRAAT